MSYLRPLGAVPVDTPPPAPGTRQPPIYPLEVGGHGGYLEIRSSPADGACGVHSYPCQHPGLDVAGVQGTPVVAPENGTIVMAGNGNLSPYVGYGPWFVIVQGDQSGRYHLLAHLDQISAAMAPLGAQVTAGAQIGTTSSANHTHWEVRDKMVPDFASGETNIDNNIDPIAWLASGKALMPMLLAGGAALLIYLIMRRTS